MSFSSTRSTALVVGSVWIAHPVRAQTTLDFQWEPVADGVVAVIATSVGGNAAIVAREDAVVVVDTHAAPSVAARVVEAIRSRWSAPVTHVVNTHWHIDHLHGNVSYRDAFPAVRIVAHRTVLDAYPRRAEEQLTRWPDFWGRTVDGTRRRLEGGIDERGNPLDAAGRRRMERLFAHQDALLAELRTFRDAAPTTAVDSTLQLVPSAPVHIMFLGRGHTDGDLVVFLPGERVLISGDLLLGFVEYPVDYLETLRAVVALDFDVIIPGHGPVERGKDRVRAMIAELEALIAFVRQRVAAGDPAETVLAAVQRAELVRLLMPAEAVVQRVIRDVSEEIRDVSEEIRAP